ncbi:hypothetical protein BGZ75_006521 [Mortierella antarctica]|nr:hypothetical protein BGZ67_009473 [Mortierella alpina]KAF9989375.1 hypothetical protein BGZ75_006521 [Mortierella antarctica]
MRIATFIPAVLALTLFSATQAAPTGNSIDLLKRDGRADIDAFVDAYVKLETKIISKVFAKVTADLCADLDVEVNAVANVGNGILTAEVDVEKIRLSTKAEAEVVATAKIDAEVRTKVTATVKATIDHVLIKLCPIVSVECIDKNAAAIVAAVNADVYVKIKEVLVNLKAEVEAHIRLRLKAIIRKVTLDLGLVNVQISARIWIASNVNVLIEAVVKVWVDLCAKINLKALIKAL